MLEEYFMTTLSRPGKGKGGSGGEPRAGNGKGEEEDGDDAALCISSLPLLLEGHSPVPEALPMFLLRLTTEVCVRVCVRACVFMCVLCCIIVLRVSVAVPRVNAAARVLLLRRELSCSRSRCAAVCRSCCLFSGVCFTAN